MMLIIIVILITMKAVVTTMMIIATISAQTETSRRNEQNLQRFFRGKLAELPGQGGASGLMVLGFRFRVQGARVFGYTSLGFKRDKEAPRGLGFRELGFRVCIVGV